VVEFVIDTLYRVLIVVRFVTGCRVLIVVRFVTGCRVLIVVRFVTGCRVLIVVRFVIDRLLSANCGSVCDRHAIEC
jgi:uncharacterized membrane protein